MSKYKLNYDTRWWTCGDGCCDDQFTTITVNGIEIGTYSFFNDIDVMKLIIDSLNSDEVNEYTLKCAIEIDEYGELDDVLYFNNKKTDGCISNLNALISLFEKLKVSYTYIEQDWDYQSWCIDKELILEDKIEHRKFD